MLNLGTDLLVAFFSFWLYTSPVSVQSITTESPPSHRVYESHPHSGTVPSGRMSQMSD